MMDAKMKGMVMAGMMGLSLVLGLMAVLGGSWLTSDEFMGEEVDGDTEVTYGLNAMHIEDPDGDCDDDTADAVEDVYTGMEVECVGDTLLATWSMSDQCDFFGDVASDAKDAGLEGDDLDEYTDAEDDACSTASAGTMGTIGMWGGVVLALVATLMMVLPMAGIDAMDGIPEIGQKVISWGAGGLMLLGMLLWFFMLPDGDASGGMTLYMAGAAMTIGLGSTAIGQFIPENE